MILLAEIDGVVRRADVTITEAERDMVLRGFESLPKTFLTKSGMRVHKDHILGVIEPVVASTPFHSMTERIALLGVGLRLDGSSRS